MYGGFGIEPNGEILQDNIWANMDFIFNPVTTKKKIRDEQKAEAMKKIEEENKRKNEEFEAALKNLEELKKKYMLMSQQTSQIEEIPKVVAKKQPIKQPVKQPVKKQAKQVKQPKQQKKTPNGKK